MTSAITGQLPSFAAIDRSNQAASISSIKSSINSESYANSEARSGGFGSVFGEQRSQAASPSVPNGQQESARSENGNNLPSRRRTSAAEANESASTAQTQSPDRTTSSTTADDDSKSESVARDSTVDNERPAENGQGAAQDQGQDNVASASPAQTSGAAAPRTANEPARASLVDSELATELRLNLGTSDATPAAQPGNPISNQVDPAAAQLLDAESDDGTVAQRLAALTETDETGARRGPLPAAVQDDASSLTPRGTSTVAALADRSSQFVDADPNKLSASLANVGDTPEIQGEELSSTRVVDPRVALKDPALTGAERPGVGLQLEAAETAEKFVNPRAAVSDLYRPAETSLQSITPGRTEADPFTDRTASLQTLQLNQAIQSNEATVGLAANVGSAERGAAPTGGTASTTAIAAVGSGLAGVSGQSSTSALQSSDLPEYTLTRTAGSSEFAEEFANRMQVMMRDGVKEARLQLNPAELGRLQVTISTDGDQARVAFLADTSGARDLIEQSLPKLRDMLEQQGLQLAQSDVGQRDAQARGDDKGESSGGNQVAQVAEDAVAATQVPQLASTTTGEGRFDAYA
ncbi:MAG: flagellar hook-length control protein FliK [Pseudomonadota bacterium]